jgi:glutamyl-tRNA reductase
MRVLLVGMNHRTAPVEVRERFAVDDPLPWLQKLVESPEIEEAVLLSTCKPRRADRHRTQPRRRPPSAAIVLPRELGGGAPLPAQRSENAVLYEHVDTDAVRHLFRVARRSTRSSSASRRSSAR